MDRPAGRYWVIVAGASIATIIVAGVVSMLTTSGDGRGGSSIEQPVETLAGATLFATGHSDYFSQTEFDGSLDELPPLNTASLLIPGDDNEIWVVFDRFYEERKAIRINIDEEPEWNESRLIYPLHSMTMDSDGLEGLLEPTRTGDGQLVASPFWQRYEPTRFPAWTVALDDDGNLLVGSADDARIDLFDHEARPRRLVGPPGDAEAEAHLADPITRILRIVPFDDGRIAFLALASDATSPDPSTPTTTAGDDPPSGPRRVEFTAEQLRLYVLDGTDIHQVDTDLTNLLTPAPTGTDEGGARRDALPLEPIAPGPEPAVSTLPDNKLITIGHTPQGPTINVLDIDTGDTTHLITLDGIQPSYDEPVTATLVHGDLYFLADGRLWHLPDAYP